MLPIKAIRLSLGELLAADTAYLANAAALKIALIMAEFTPTEDLAFADITLADFTGSTPLAFGTGTQQAGNDPDTGDQRVTMKDPAGGLRWETTALTNLPQTIYGFALLDNAGTVLLATELLPVPLALTEVGQEVTIGSARMTIVLEPLS